LKEEGEEKERKNKEERKKLPWGRRISSGWTSLAGCGKGTAVRCI
jgi:hypothetical protein